MEACLPSFVAHSLYSVFQSLTSAAADTYVDGGGCLRLERSGPKSKSCVLQSGSIINFPRDGSRPSDQNINDRVIFEPGILSPNGFLLGNDFRSWYHSFQRRYQSGFQRVLSILDLTVSRNRLTEAPGHLGATVHPFNLHDERGRSIGTTSCLRGFLVMVTPSIFQCGCPIAAG